MKLLAKIISYIFHPSTIPTIGIVIIFNTNSYINYALPYELKKAVVLLTMVSTFIIPTLFTLLLQNRKLINSIEMETARERILPYGFTIFFYFFTMYMMEKVAIPPIMYKFMIGATVSVILAFIINLKWKISAHLIGMGGLTGALIAISFVLNLNLISVIAFTFLASGMVASSRLLLEAHTSKQVYAGFFVGFICQILAINF